MTALGLIGRIAARYGMVLSVTYIQASTSIVSRDKPLINAAIVP